MFSCYRTRVRGRHGLSLSLPPSLSLRALWVRCARPFPHSIAAEGRGERGSAPAEFLNSISVEERSLIEAGLLKRRDEGTAGMRPSRVLLIGSRARCIFVLADNDGNVWLASLLSSLARPFRHGGAFPMWRSHGVSATRATRVVICKPPRPSFLSERPARRRGRERTSLAESVRGLTR